jgi:hypothetical protein
MEVDDRATAELMKHSTPPCWETNANVRRPHCARSKSPCGRRSVGTPLATGLHSFSKAIGSSLSSGLANRVGCEKARPAQVGFREFYSFSNFHQTSRSHEDAALTSRTGLGEFGCHFNGMPVLRPSDRCRSDKPARSAKSQVGATTVAPGSGGSPDRSMPAGLHVPSRVRQGQRPLPTDRLLRDH